MQGQTKQPRQIFVWGFTETELQRWPGELRPIDMAALSDTQLQGRGAIVVHARAVDEFTKAADAQLDQEGRLPDAVLYRSNGENGLSPDLVSTYFDAEVRAGDWTALQNAVAHDLLYQALEWAEDVSVKEWAESALDLSDEHLWQAAREQLPQAAHESVRDEVCRARFVERIRERIHQRRILIAPPAKRLIAYLRQSAQERQDQWIEIHLQHDRAARTAARWMEKRIQEETTRQPISSLILWVSASLPDLATLRQRLPDISFDDLKAWPSAPVIVGLNEQMSAAAAGARRTEADSTTQPDLDQEREKQELENVSGALAELEAFDEVDIGGTVAGLERFFVLRHDESASAVVIEAMRSGDNRPIERFRIELTYGDQDFTGDSEDGQISIPVDQLIAALSEEDGARLRIWTSGEENTGR